MRLYEFQGKRLLREAGVPVPEGQLIGAGGARELALGPPLMLKAQVLAGGRGKAGLICGWDGSQRAEEAVASVLDGSIRGEKVSAVLAERRVSLERELYLSLTYRGDRAEHLLTAGAVGGMEIEETARTSPEKVISLPVDPFTGPTGYQLRLLARHFDADRHEQLRELLEKLFGLYVGMDATLLEINPLALTPDGFMALDAKVVLDEKARFRHREAFAALEQEQAELAGVAAPGEPESPYTITYVRLRGSVGLISDGAGTGMLTLDLLADEGAAAACFCELGGLTNAEVMRLALERVAGTPGMRSLLIVLIGGFNRMDHMAEGIVGFVQERGLPVPLIVRMCGTREQEGKATMDRAGLATFDDLPQAVRAAARAAGAAAGGKAEAGDGAEGGKAEARDGAEGAGGAARTASGRPG